MLDAVLSSEMITFPAVRSCLLYHNFARTIWHYVFESVKSADLERLKRLGFIQLMTDSDR